MAETKPTEIADARIAEIEAGLKGVTPGPWWTDSERSDEFDAFAVYSPEPRYGQPAAICDTHNSGVACLEREDGRPWDEQGRKDMAHIARCDPDTIAALIARLRRTQAELAEAREALSGLLAANELSMDEQARAEARARAARAGLPPTPATAGKENGND